MTIQGCYAALNANLPDAAGRLQGLFNVEKYLRMLPGEGSMERLQAALAQQHWAQAFQAAHTLQGVSAMLGLEKLSALAGEAAEALREGRTPLCLRALERQFRQTTACIAALDQPEAELWPQELYAMARCFEHMPEPLGILRAETGRLVYANAAMRGREDELQEPTWRQMIHEAAWQNRSGRQGLLTVWPYAPGYAACRLGWSGMEMLSMISHDLRTPLHVITGLATSMRCGAAPEEAQACLERIHLASRHLEAMVGSVLDAVGGVELSTESFSLADMLRQTVMLLQVETISRRLQLRLCLEALTQEYVAADRCRMERIALNLICNAVKYTQPGGTVVVSARKAQPESDGRVMYELIVQDTGRGMGEDTLHRAFDSDARAEESWQAGAGLGLVIVRRLVRMMDGEVLAHSQPGQGTTVTVRLPLRPVRKPAVQRFDGVHALLVDDCQLSAETTAIILSRLGFRVDVAASDFDALRRARRYDCVFLDVHLADMDGCTVAATLRRRITAEQLPIFALSADDTAAVRFRVQEAGMQGLIAKPVREDALLEAASPWLAQRLCAQ